MEQDDLVANVMAVTGCEDSVARFHLEASGWNVEVAVAQLLDSGQPTSSSLNSFDQDDEVRAPDRVKQQRLLSEGYMRPRESSQVAARPGAFADYRTEAREGGDDEDEMDAVFGRDEGDEDGSSSRRSGGAAAAASTGDTLSRLFAMPTKLMHVGDFQSARREAKMERKWLLVCVIDDADFQCVAMNRDCWADETVQAIVESQFVLWMRPHLDQEAIVYADRYDKGRTLPASPREDDESSSRRQLFYVHPKHPHLGIIDPRTGRRLWMREGALDADRLIEALSDVSDRHSMDDEPRQPPPSLPLHPPEGLLDDAPAASPPPPPPPEVVASVPWNSSTLQSEPETGGILINFRLVDKETGKTITRKRRFDESETVSALFKFAQLETGAGPALFELRAGFPPKQLWQFNQQSLTQADLRNQSVHMKFANP